MHQIDHPTTLTSIEKTIFNQIMMSFTLKHGTSYTKNIQEAGGVMRALRQREQGGEIANNRHSGAEKGHDNSLFFVMGIGDHKLPHFVSKCSDIISIDLAQMAKIDPLTTNRLWVSGHLTEFQLETSYRSKLGNVKYIISHHSDYTKTYDFYYDNPKFPR